MDVKKSNFRLWVVWFFSSFFFHPIRDTNTVRTSTKEKKRVERQKNNQVYHLHRRQRIFIVTERRENEADEEEEEMKYFLSVQRMKIVELNIDVFVEFYSSPSDSS